jgi:hypothetical protein
MKFTKGNLEKISNEYYNLTLFNNENIVYKSTVPKKEAVRLVNKYNNIVIL